LSHAILLGSDIIPPDHAIHPVSQLQNRLTNTYHHIDALSALVELSPGTFMQYQGIKGRELLLELSKEEKLPEPETHLDEFFDSYEDLPEYSEIFFEASKTCQLKIVMTRSSHWTWVWILSTEIAS
jgi:hypothetical protein